MRRQLLARGAASDSKWLIDGSGPIAAVLEKELRTIPRSMPLLFAICAPLLTVLVISTVFRNGALGVDVRSSSRFRSAYATHYWVSRR